MEDKKETIFDIVLKLFEVHNDEFKYNSITQVLYYTDKYNGILNIKKTSIHDGSYPIILYIVNLLLNSDDNIAYIKDLKGIKFYYKNKELLVLLNTRKNVNNYYTIDIEKYYNKIMELDEDVENINKIEGLTDAFKSILQMNSNLQIEKSYDNIKKSNLNLYKYLSVLGFGIFIGFNLSKLF